MLPQQSDEERALVELRTRVTSAQGKRDLLQSQLRDLLSRRDAAKGRAHLAKEAAALLHQATSAARTQLQRLVEPLMSEALQQLLGGQARFHLRFGTSAGKVIARLVTITDKGLEVEGIDSFGGGVADLESMLFRLIFIARLGLPRVVILDEPFRNIHGHGALETIADFLRTLVDELGYQIIVVTGDEDVSASAADAIFQVAPDDAGADVQRVR